MSNIPKNSNNVNRSGVAIVADWIIGGGAEWVVLELHRMFPYAPIYTSYCTPEWRKRLNNKVVTGYLQYWPFPQLRKFIPGMRARWFERLDLEEYDLVISSSGAEAKGIRVDKNANHSKLTTNHSDVKRPLHISYIHAPTHYYWSRYDDYIKHPGFGIFNPLARIGLKLLVGRRRKWDFKAAQRPSLLISNSSHTQSEIKKYYHRDSTVIHPPVDTDFFASSEFQVPKSSRCGYVVVGRQTPYKRIDLAIRACNELSLPLLVIGNGPEHKKLAAMAGPTVFFKTDATREDIARALCSAKGFIFPGIDDFGIAPVEALASGTPVLAYKAGGALDYITPGKNGEFFSEQNTGSLVTTLKRFNAHNYASDEIKKSSSAFCINEFVKSMTKYINKVV